MLTFAAIAAAGFAAYGPPTNQEAFAAYVAPVLAPLREAGEVILEAELYNRREFPLDVVLQRCLRKNDRKVEFESGAIDFFAGYECVFEVRPNAEPAFHSFGFFRHDGFDWVYHGPGIRTEMSPPKGFDSLTGKGRMIKKPGALNYDGSPQNPMNPKYDPYQDYFDDTGWADVESYY